MNVRKHKYGFIASWGYTANGKRHRFSKVFKQKRDANIWGQEEERKHRIKHRLGDPFSDLSQLTIADLIALYQDTAAYAELRESTSTRYNILIRNFQAYCNEHDITLAATFNEAQAVRYKKHLEKHFKGKGIIHGLTMAKILFKPLPVNPFADLKIPKPVRQPVRFLSDEELKAILDNASPFTREILTFLHHTGLRTGELFNLTWADVRPTSILIRPKKGWEPKTESSIRTVSLSKTAGLILEQWRDRTDGKGYVLLGDRPMSESTLRKYFLVARRRAQQKNPHLDLSEIKVHYFRKTFGSHLLQKGVDIAVISKLLGHSSIATTEQIYADLRRENFDDAVKKLDE